MSTMSTMSNDIQEAPATHKSQSLCLGKEL
jgi:hypothetical protein